MSTPDQNSTIGPFTKENWNQAQWKHVTDKIYQLNPNNEEETIPDCNQILQLLRELNQHPNYNEYFGDPAIKNYFFKEFFLNNAKYLIATKNFRNPHVLDLSNKILEEIALFWIKAIDEDHPKLAEAVKNIFDPERAYFKINDQEDIITGIVPSFLAAPSEEHLAWIQSLKEGDNIDCVKMEGQYKKMCWSHAQVVAVSDTHITISYFDEKDELNKELSKTANANEIAPYKKRCTDYEWRENLNDGDEVDASDTSNVWYNATVLRTRIRKVDEKNIKEIFIGYRVYDEEEGDRYDSEGRKFIGWSSKYDEWFSIANPRIRQKNSMAKKFFMGSSSNNEDVVLDDANDKIYSIEGQRIYGLTRPGHCKSIFTVGLVNKFGEQGGFDKILQRISDIERWAPIEVVSIMMTILENLNSVLHRDFVYEYVPRLKEAVWRNLLESPESNIRNFTKERIDSILNAFDILLKRAYSLPEKNEMVESLNLQICSICFDSKFLERKLQGLKSLLEVLKQVKFGHAKFITNEYLNEFIETNQIFDKIYGNRGHTQLIQRSSEFLKFLIGEGNLSPEELEVVWSSTRKGDTETKLATYKVLSDISVHLQNSHLDFLIEKIAKIPATEMIQEEIDLIYELNRLSSKTSGFTKKALDFYWTIITDTSNRYSSELVEFTLGKYCDIVRGWDLKEERLEALHHCVENVEKNFAVLNSLKIMKKLIEQHSISVTSTDKLTKRSCIEHLCSDKQLLKIIIHDLKSFKENIKRRCGDAKEIREEDLNFLVNERAPYLTAVGERLQFILYIFANNETGSGTSSLTYEHLSELWDIMVNQALLPGERDVVYKWIKETAESKSGFPMKSQDLLKFFQEKINNAQSYETMTIEGFNCVKNLFLIINEKLGKISKVKANSVTTHPSSYNGYGVSYHSYSYNYEETKAAPPDFEYVVNVLPEELEGVQSIWNFILTAKNEEVVEKAVDFLNKLYLYVNEELESKITLMRSEYLSICFKNLQDVLTKKDQSNQKEFASNCLRCLSLIRSIMDESEKKGIGNLKAHSGLVKGELMTVNIINELTSSSDVPKKVDIKLHSNTTVYKLRVEVGKQLKATWDQVKLARYIGAKEIKDNENGRTLGDIRLKNGESLIATKRPTPPIPQATLLLPDNSFNPEAKVIFEGWFRTFSENGKMNSDGCAAFIHSCTGDNCKGDDKRVKEVFATYDDDHDGFLTLENFLEFYYLACKQRPGVVWSNLVSHHYRNDLKKVTEVEEEKIDFLNLPRYIISQNKKYFSAIFSLLDCGGSVANEAWKLLNRLPTSPEIFTNILLLEGVRDVSGRNWNNFLDANSTYKLLYSLHVLEYLMEDDESEKDDNKEDLHWATDPKLVESKKNWRADFIAYGGFDHLFKIFNLFSRKDHATLTLFEKNIISFILKILKNYLTATFASSVPYMYRSMSFIKLLVPLDFISKYIAEASKEGSTNQQDAQKAENKNKQDEKKKENLKIEETNEFKLLVERLKGDLGNQILSKIELKEFVKSISTLGYDILQKTGDFESEDRMILEDTTSILVAILLYDKSLLKYFLNFDKRPENYNDAEKYIIEGVFCSKSLIVRRHYSHAFYVLCKYTKDYENALSSKYLINLLLQNLPTSDDESKKDCHQYFELLCKLLEETYAIKEGDSEEETFDFKGLIETVVKRLKDHVSTEKRQNPYALDRILIGLLNLCEKIIVVRPQLKEYAGSEQGMSLIKELFEVCLFCTRPKEAMFQDVIGDADTNKISKDYVKCKSKDSRNVAYKLLISLCKNHNANLSVLLTSSKDLITSFYEQKITQVWNYSPSADTRSVNGYAGIRNLGCICYMNAMLQQFFMTPAFRYAILAADDKQEPVLVNKDNRFMVDDNVLHQLQQMFGFLELTDRRDYNPHEFCFAFKDFSGTRVNVTEQQDAQEFLNTIFDRLEKGLKQTPFRQIMEGVYGGKTSNQIICHGCKNIRKKEEPFYNMSVEVRNMKTVFDSFEQFIAGETIEDYNCEACQQKNSITKRTCLSYLPNVFIVHLKRIVFDLDTLMNQKINSRLEFPFELDMEPYTAEGLAWRERRKEKEANKGQNTNQNGEQEVDQDKVKERKEDDEEGEGEGEEKENKKKPIEEEQVEGPYQLHPKEYYQYRLAGVVVHVGTAEIGHYYSYININRGENSNNTKNDKWLEFNDSTIKEFDLKNLEKETFGGAGGDSSDDYWGSWTKSGRENSKNAYILVYERVAKDSLKFIVDQPEDEAILNKVLNIENILKEKPEAVTIQKEEVEDPQTKEKRTREIYNCDYFMLKRFIPSNIYKKVWEENHKFMFERHLYNEDFFEFFKEICKSLTFPEVDKTMVNFIMAGHNDVTTELKEMVLIVIAILSWMIFFVLAKSDDKKNIVELTEQLIAMVSLVPETAHMLFDSLVCKNVPSALELFVSCPDKQVRQCTTRIILHIINVLISKNGFTLDGARLDTLAPMATQLSQQELALCIIETSVLSFLQLLINLLPTEVPKNWTKLGQYFEFWRDFAASGEAQMTYLYSKQFIAVLGDFFLEKKSPLTIAPDKKHSMGNRFAEPEFGPLIETIAHMVRRAEIKTQTETIPQTSLAKEGKKLFPLSEDDWKVLTFREFYEKAMKGKHNSSALGLIIQQLGFENETFGYHIADIGLRGINKAGFDDSLPYLEALMFSFEIRDFLQIKRAEWIFGFPEPIVAPTTKGHDSFGIYCNSSLEDFVVSYESTLNNEGIPSIINYMLQTRKRHENITLLLLLSLLKAMECSQAMFEYILFLPPPCNLYAKFTDWIPPFLDYYHSESKRFSYTSYHKENLFNEVVRLWRATEAKINARLDLNERLMNPNAQQQTQLEVISDPQTEQTSPTKIEESISGYKDDVLLRRLNPTYIIGETAKEEEIDRIILSQPETDEIYLSTNEVSCFITESKPTGTTNLALPRSVLQDTKFKNDDIAEESPLAHFIRPKGLNVVANNQAVGSNPDRIRDEDDAAIQSKFMERFLGPENDDTPYSVPYQGLENIRNLIKPELVSSASETSQELSNTAVEGQVEKHDAQDDVMDVESPAKQEEVVQNKNEPTIEITAEKKEVHHIDLEIASMFRRFVLHNTSEYLVNCQIGIFPKTNTINFRIPSIYYKSVKPKSSLTLLYLMKMLPFMDWGEYEVKCQIQLLEAPAPPPKQEDDKKKSNIFQIRGIPGGYGIGSGYNLEGISEDEFYMDPFS